MRSFECLIRDDRHQIPRLTWLVVGDVARARELARRELMQDDHHQSVEVRENGRVVFRVRRADLAPEGRPPVGESSRSFRRPRRD